MPIYEYKCSKCDNVFEKIVPNSQSPAPACPNCGDENVAKKFSTFSARTASPAPACPSAPMCPSGGCCGGSCPM